MAASSWWVPQFQGATDWGAFYQGLTPATTYAASAASGANPGAISGGDGSLSSSVWGFINSIGDSAKKLVTNPAAALGDPSQSTVNAVQSADPTSVQSLTGDVTNAGQSAVTAVNGAIESWFPRIAVVVLGFIFVAIGLAMFKTGGSAVTVVSGGVGKVANAAKIG